MDRSLGKMLVGNILTTAASIALLSANLANAQCGRPTKNFFNSLCSERR